MDKNIRIQDDLFTYVNQEKLDQLVIPDDKPTAGGFSELRDQVEETMMNEFLALEKDHIADYITNSHSGGAEASCTALGLIQRFDNLEAGAFVPCNNHLRNAVSVLYDKRLIRMIYQDDPDFSPVVRVHCAR